MTNKIVSKRIFDMQYDIVNKATGHFFDADTMRFWHSRLPQVAYSNNDLEAYFITSEQSGNQPRKYTIRCFNFASKQVHTVGEYYDFSSKSEAMTELKRLLQVQLDMEREVEQAGMERKLSNGYA